MNNPYLKRARKLSNIESKEGLAYETKALEIEFLADGSVKECKCGGKAYFNAPVGTHKCIECGSVYLINSEKWV